MEEFSLGDVSGAVQIDVNDFRIRIDELGCGVKVFSKTPANVTFAGSIKASKTETAIAVAQKALKIGDIVKEGENKGWIYAGLSEDVESPGYNKPLFVAPEITGVMTCFKASEVISDLRKKEGKDRLPTNGELTQIFETFAKKNIRNFGREDYWAVEYYNPFNHVVPYQRFSHDKTDINGKGLLKVVQLVR